MNLLIGDVQGCDEALARLLDEAGNVLAKGTSTATLFDRAKVEAAAKAAIGG